MKNPYQVVRVFHKANEAQGNLAAIYFDDEDSERFELIKVSSDIEKKQGITTTCFIKHIIDEQYLVRCFNGENEIQCCGHGMIAAAKSILLERELLSVILNGNLTAAYAVKKDGNKQITLTLPRICSELQETPSWASNSVTIKGKVIHPNDFAISAENNGYMLFEYEPLLPLDDFSALQLNLKQVCDNTKRAIVLLQFNKEKQHLYLRYFAPQYGVVEDAATGSVMRFVADYIERKYQCSCFEVNQCSAQGGYMKVDCKIEKIIITANATIET